MKKKKKKRQRSFLKIFLNETFTCHGLSNVMINIFSNYQLPILLPKYFDNHINLLQLWMNDFHVSTYLPMEEPLIFHTSLAMVLTHLPR
jgi:hypothetical protein